MVRQFRRAVQQASLASVVGETVRIRTARTGQAAELGRDLRVLHCRFRDEDQSVDVGRDRGVHRQADQQSSGCDHVHSKDSRESQIESGC